MKPLAIDLFCGLGGWTEGLLTEGYYVVGFDNVRHVYGEHRYPAQLVIQDVLTLHGKQFKDAALIVASPPCQGYSYRAMPWKRAKALPPPDNSLFDACFRIQREACAAAGRHIPMVVENVRGAQPWVGRSRWNYGSFHLWGDVPALMPMTKHLRVAKAPGQDWSRFKESGEVSPDWKMQGSKNDGGSWFGIGPRGELGSRNNPDGRNDQRDDVKVIAHLNQRNGHKSTAHLTNPAEHIKCGGDWFGPCEDSSAMRNQNSRSPKRKAASAMIAKIPEQLARHI